MKIKQKIFFLTLLNISTSFFLSHSYGAVVVTGGSLGSRTIVDREGVNEQVFRSPGHPLVATDVAESLPGGAVNGTGSYAITNYDFSSSTTSESFNFGFTHVLQLNSAASERGSTATDGIIDFSLVTPADFQFSGNYNHNSDLELLVGFSLARLLPPSSIPIEVLVDGSTSSAGGSINVPNDINFSSGQALGTLAPGDYQLSYIFRTRAVVGSTSLSGTSTGVFGLTLTQVPECSTFAMFAIMNVGLLLARKRGKPGLA